MSLEPSNTGRRTRFGATSSSSIGDVGQGSSAQGEHTEGSPSEHDDDDPSVEGREGPPPPPPGGFVPEVPPHMAGPGHLPQVLPIIDPATFQQQMFNMMNLLTQSIAANNSQVRQSSATPAPSNNREPKVKDPETFHGQRDSLNAFLTECELVFELQPSRFGDDRIKVSYMISLLRGTPLLAVRPFLSHDPRPLFLDSHLLFVDYLRTNYGDSDEKGTARRKLKALRQSGPASAYFAELQQYIAVLGWKEHEPIIDRAIDGLRPYLKDEVARSGLEFASLNELMRYIIPLDNRLYERDQERKRETGSTKVVNVQTRVGINTPTQVSSTVTAPRNPIPSQPQANFGQGGPTSTFQRGPLSDAEKQRRRDAGACVRCGKMGHYAANCPGAQNHPAVQVQVKTEPVQRAEKP